MKPIRCSNGGLVVQVPPGGRRLCGCGTWLSADDDATPEVLPLEADLAKLSESRAEIDGIAATHVNKLAEGRDVLARALEADLERLSRSRADIDNLAASHVNHLAAGPDVLKVSVENV